MILALLLGMAGPAASTAPPPPTANVPAPVRADSLALVQIVNPERLMVEMVVRGFADSIRLMAGSNEDYLALEEDYPGISEALVGAMVAVIRADTIADLPAMRDRYARFYAQQFSPAETAELARIVEIGRAHV